MQSYSGPLGFSPLTNTFFGREYSPAHYSQVGKENTEEVTETLGISWKLHFLTWQAVDQDLTSRLVAMGPLVFLVPPEEGRQPPWGLTALSSLTLL